MNHDAVTRPPYEFAQVRNGAVDFADAIMQLPQLVIDEVFNQDFTRSLVSRR
ncbi:hypothetical protein [Lacipirellula sp.]|uniref:hypothetical protein n=1 Tax=Lacipirellula sp. TaxID=2691419 RepID=UPI003D0C8B65